MILIEPTIQARFGRALRRRTLAVILRQACEVVRLHGDVSVLLTSDAHLRRLNLEFRHKDCSTDVLSFPAPESLNGYRGMAGDLAISVETAARQAEERAHPLATELQILILHGLLHLAGYDHEADHGKMARKEATLRRRFGLSEGLIERSANPAPKNKSTLRRSGKP
jgi:probable rRNA maturation factor